MKKEINKYHKNPSSTTPQKKPKYTPKTLAEKIAVVILACLILLCSFGGFWGVYDCSSTVFGNNNTAYAEAVDPVPTYPGWTGLNHTCSISYNRFAQSINSFYAIGQGFNLYLCLPAIMISGSPDEGIPNQTMFGLQSTVSPSLHINENIGVVSYGSSVYYSFLFDSLNTKPSNWPDDLMNIIWIVQMSFNTYRGTLSNSTPVHYLDNFVVPPLDYVVYDWSNGIQYEYLFFQDSDIYIRLGFQYYYLPVYSDTNVDSSYTGKKQINPNIYYEFTDEKYYLNNTDDTIVNLKVQFENEKQKAVDDAFYRGQQEGYAEGLRTAESGDFYSLLDSVFFAPLKAFYSLLNFEVLGVNMFYVATSLLTLFLILLILKFVINIIL